MTEKPDSDDATDADIRAALTRPVAPPSSSHDETILAAAERAGRDLRAPRRARWLAPLALAAGVALFGVWRMVAPPVDTVRGGESAPAVVPADRAMLESAPTTLSWPEVAGASTYRIELRDARGAVLGNAVTTGTQIEVAKLAPHALEPGTYFWTLFAGGPALEMLYGPYSFHVAQPR